jgi:hypothetical protein
LHNGKLPYLAVSLQGGIIIDLATTEIESQVSSLLEVRELTPDDELRTFLSRKIAEIKAEY